jgi:proline dehydrogenase
MLRSLFLFLSHQKHLRQWMETSPVAGRLSERFVAGRSLADAVAVTRRINGEGIAVTLDRLGENVTSLEESAASRDACLDVLDAIHEARLEANVSIKLTQFGMDLSESRCRENVERLVASAAALGNFVRLDMESGAYTERTLRVVEDLHACNCAMRSLVGRTRASAAIQGDRPTEPARSASDPGERSPTTVTWPRVRQICAA